MHNTDNCSANSIVCDVTAASLDLVLGHKGWQQEQLQGLSLVGSTGGGRSRAGMAGRSWAAVGAADRVTYSGAVGE